MSSRVLTSSSLHLHRARIFFLVGNTQQVETSVVLRELVRAVAALATLAAWIAVLVVLA
jgi:hypothetical protein